SGLVSIRQVGNYWSVAANESKIAYAYNGSGGTFDVWVANVDGTGTPVHVLDAAVAGFNAWWVSVSCDGEWVGYGALSNKGGTYNTVTGQSYAPPAYFNNTSDGVFVGPTGEF
ncbi:MAG: hypothetical protein ABI743_05080, partial [bacterium]